MGSAVEEESRPNMDIIMPIIWLLIAMIVRYALLYFGLRKTAHLPKLKFRHSLHRLRYPLRQLPDAEVENEPSSLQDARRVPEITLRHNDCLVHDKAMENAQDSRKKFRTINHFDLEIANDFLHFSRSSSSPSPNCLRIKLVRFSCNSRWIRLNQVKSVGGSGQLLVCCIFTIVICTFNCKIVLIVEATLRFIFLEMAYSATEEYKQWARAIGPIVYYTRLVGKFTIIICVVLIWMRWKKRKDARQAASLAAQPAAVPAETYSTAPPFTVTTSYPPVPVYQPPPPPPLSTSPGYPPTPAYPTVPGYPTPPGYPPVHGHSADPVCKQPPPLSMASGYPTDPGYPTQAQPYPNAAALPPH
ncbi:hypothetical protein PRIPAC_87794 [Pristionchus pacificus]|uniref:Uncharacterized protein n=1 Tax=Pristionchus pacificus TaxID=54126 RepID=A0A2A6CWV9_PRIPA|nr:hypothetical protein PRIPAC_87794 [Pristionchus pacificus]|eukprot:PDM82665.1 hypothetical protein PRIPAC_37058 [Pristionchus pacificus]